MRSKILLLPFFFFALMSQAQDSSFQLKDYKYRTPGFRALSVNVSFAANASDLEQDKLSKSKTSSLSLFPAQFNYYRIVSTDKRMHTSFFYFSPSLYSYNNETDNNKTESTNLKYAFTWDRNDRFYKKRICISRSATVCNMNFLKSRTRIPFTKTSLVCSAWKIPLH
jgi:hypothetical protein